MASEEENDLDQAAYRRLRPEIDRNYPKGRLVAIWDGTVIADAADLDEMTAKLRSKGLHPPDILVAQSGAEYYEYFDVL